MDDSTKIIKDYKEKTDEIIDKMYHVLLRAQRKVDDLKYRQTLKKVGKI